MIQRIINVLKVSTLLVVAATTGIVCGHVFKSNALLSDAIAAQQLRASVIMGEIGKTSIESPLFVQVEPKKDIPLRKVRRLAQVQPVVKSQLPVAAPKVVATVATRNFLIVGHNKRLADTIIVVSMNEKENSATLISIPRDLFVDGRKINEYLSLYDIETLKEKVSAVTSLPIHQYVVFDFTAFERVIDAFGGIDVYVAKAISDGSYPGKNGTYSPYSIAKGDHHMSGAQALRYARSRYTSSDFDRSRRQHEIIRAVQARVKDLGAVEALRLLPSLLSELSGSSIDTDMGTTSLIGYVRRVSDIKLSSAEIFSTANYLYSTYSKAGQYVLMPRGENFTQIQKYIREAVAS